MKMYERNPGQGRTALLIHPMLSSAEGIELCVTNFWGEGVHCFVPDLSGHGEDAAATYHSAAEEAKAIHDVLVEQGCTHLDLGFGASLGGVVLFELKAWPGYAHCGKMTAESQNYAAMLKQILES